MNVDSASTAARRRQRLRHERMTVAINLAEMTHHTAPRGPKMARAGKEVVRDAHDALRGQKTPPPGVRPGSLVDPAQRSDRSLRRSAGNSLPTLALSSLAGSAGEEMDYPTLSFLTQSVLKTREEEEKKVQAMREEVRDPDGWNQAFGSDGVQFFWHVARAVQSGCLLPVPRGGKGR